MSTMTSQVMELNRRILISDFDSISSENFSSLQSYSSILTNIIYEYDICLSWSGLGMLNKYSNISLERTKISFCAS